MRRVAPRVDLCNRWPPPIPRRLRPSRHDEAPVQGLDGDAHRRSMIEGAIGRLEAGGDGLEGADAECPCRHGALDFVSLSRIAHLRAAAEPDLAVGDAGLAQHRAALRLHLREERVHAAPVRLVEALGRGADEVEGQRRREEAEGGSRARPEGHEHAGHLEDASDLPGVHRSRAAEGIQRVGAQVLAALDAVNSCGRSHVLVDDPMYVPGGSRQVGAHGRPDPVRDRPPRRVHVEPHSAPQEEVRIEIAQHEIGIGDRRLAATQAVAGGARVGPRAVGPDLQEAHAIEPSDGAAARPDLDQLDDGHANGQARTPLEAVGPCHLELAREQRLAAVDDAGLGGGAAHVE